MKEDKELTSLLNEVTFGKPEKQISVKQAEEMWKISYTNWKETLIVWKSEGYIEESALDSAKICRENNDTSLMRELTKFEIELLEHIEELERKIEVLDDGSNSWRSCMY